MIVSVDMPEVIVKKIDDLVAKKPKMDAAYVKKVGTVRAVKEYNEQVAKAKGFSNRSDVLRKVIVAGLNALAENKPEAR